MDKGWLASWIIGLLLALIFFLTFAWDCAGFWKIVR